MSCLRARLLPFLSLLPSSLHVRLNFAAVITAKANPNSWCQEIWKLLGHQEIRESARKYQEITLIQQETWSTFVCDASVSHKRRKKSPTFFLLIVFWKSQEKNSFFDLFTVKLCIIIRNLPGNYLNLIRNQDQEITLRAPGTRVCVDRNPWQDF